MTLKVPYTDNLTTNAKLPGQIAVDMKAIEHEDQQDDQALSDEIADRKKGDGNLQGQIDKLQECCQKLEQEKATRDEVEQAKEAWKKKIKHVALGTDYETIEQAVMQILKEKGVI